MKFPIIVRVGFPCSVKECPPGHFLYKEQLCFKSEYYAKNMVTPCVFCASGEFFSSQHHGEVVDPVQIVWVDIEAESIFDRIRTELP